MEIREKINKKIGKFDYESLKLEIEEVGRGRRELAEQLTMETELEEGGACFLETLPKRTNRPDSILLYKQAHGITQQCKPTQPFSLKNKDISNFYSFNFLKNI